MQHGCFHRKQNPLCFQQVERVEQNRRVVVSHEGACTFFGDQLSQTCRSVCDHWILTLRTNKQWRRDFAESMHSTVRNRQTMYTLSTMCRPNIADNATPCLGKLVTHPIKSWAWVLVVVVSLIRTTLSPWPVASLEYTVNIAGSMLMANFNPSTTHVGETVSMRKNFDSISETTFSFTLYDNSPLNSFLSGCACDRDISKVPFAYKICE